ncbi:hypothetical protein TBLA_0E00240 [Henningerozyma blattae CBS 6284]|uniref:Importin N-terminal domain-containing protein n=1 Tax=Henningerozyma blattae (strain ATCC 34711 / CBS 6284 / DSM 70876 / NBRC 10599 / NRRL Y-10934 / UCD 77-7) TaxID=1071380 RepID=I2H3Y4_HENB6|nr:hypothetical protein TBLA_0E00240 [Tetrapisispora blattae CBS 6284]CCH61086.1 hypothetical protein TBLA_0E00240 [Tetrapisispora blattae CBS 6284]
MNIDIDSLIKQAQSPETSLREHAENSLLEWCEHDACSAFAALANVAANNTEILSSRQYSLLALRKLITMYWSPGFESYHLTSNLNETVKAHVRHTILQLALDKNQDSKIRKSGSYCIVQVSAVDFPDLWPELLVTLYKSILETHSLEALSILNEIYDDIISEEMFFEEGIGLETMRVIFNILDDKTAPVETKIAAAKLFYPCLMQMSVVSPTSSLKRMNLVIDSLKEIISKWEQILQFPLEDALLISPEEAILEWKFRGSIYEGLAFVHSNFSKKILPMNFLNVFRKCSLQDLTPASTLYINMISGDNIAFNALNKYIIHIFEYLSNISRANYEREELILILESIYKLCCLDNLIVETWNSNFNEFVSKEFGLMASYSLRDQISDFLISLSSNNFNIIFKEFITNLNNCLIIEDWRQLESMLYIFQSLLINDEDILNVANLNIENLLSSLAKNFHHYITNTILFSRLILLIPKILEKFMDDIENIKLITCEFLKQSLAIGLDNYNALIKSSCLLMVNSYCSFAELLTVLGDKTCQEVQQITLKIILQILDDSEDDTYGMIMEVINNLIDCNLPNDKLGEIPQQEFNLILSITSRDPSNVQMTVESQECLKKLLEGLNTFEYSHYIEMCFPSMVKVLIGSSVTQYKYSALLSLALEFITIFMKKKPNDGYLPLEICKFIFNPLKDVLLVSNEDETLQLSSDAFSYLIYNTDPIVMVESLPGILEVMDRLLSLDVTDSAAMNAGSLVVTVFTHFENEIKPYMKQILSGTTKRLIQAKNISTIQNLISVICYLICSNTEDTINLLSRLGTEGDILKLVLNKWISNFEIIRGERRIKQNILALNKLYCLNNSNIKHIMVDDELIPYDGDRIITRSMAKEMPDRYTQIPVYSKIIKLFIQELSEQMKQPEHNLKIEETVETIGDGNAAAADDDWEDVEDVLDYEKLQEYVDDEDDELHFGEDEDDILGTMDIEIDVKELLIRILKENASKNVSDFDKIYTTLSEDEKRILSECLV